MFRSTPINRICKRTRYTNFYWKSCRSDTLHLSLVLGICIAAAPIIFALVAYTDSFSLSWNQGRGGFLFALVFMAAELIGLKMALSRKRVIISAAMSAGVIAYLVIVESGYRQVIEESAPIYGVQLVYSWIWLWDFVVMSLFLAAVFALYFGRKWIRIAPAAPLFLGGSAVILSLDAFFPYDTLGPLQYVVPYLVQTNVWLVDVFDFGVATARDNVMFLRGDHGPMVLQVFWPSAGVHSVIIYSLVMGAFLLKMNILRQRKLAYFALGILGTIIVNVGRIFVLSWYALKVTADPQRWEEFHSIAGEIMFLPWLFVFLFIVMIIETRRLRKSKESENTT